jgi:hypothetical protein
MKNVTFLIAVAILALSCVFQTPGYAQDRSSPAAPTGPGPKASGEGSEAAVSSGPEALQYSIIQWQACCTNLAAGFNLAFQTSETCPTNGCAFVFQDMIQVGNSGTAGNRWAICGAVDGTFINPPCPFQGIVLGSNLYSVGNSLQTFHAAAGAHTLQLFVFVDAPALLANSTADFIVQIP